MKISPFLFSVIKIFLILWSLFVGILVAIWFILLFPDIAIPKLQEPLARELGVRIQDYPYPASFPIGYFDTLLQRGMSINEVHQIIRGYKKVLHCGKRTEIYYFLSQGELFSIRMMIFYDNQGGYLRWEGEDTDSRTIRTVECQPGLLGIEP